jgi:hypothetical protein
MTDDRPRPKYGEYAPVAPAAVTPEPVVAPPELATAPYPNRIRDIAVTTVLLLLGVADVVSSFSTFADLGPTLTELYKQVGIGGVASAAVAAQFGLGINIGRISVLAITVVVSLLLIARHRRAFWVPLAGFLLAGLTTTVLLAALMLNDPAYQVWLAQNQ